MSFGKVMRDINQYERRAHMCLFMQLPVTCDGFIYPSMRYKKTIVISELSFLLKNQLNDLFTNQKYSRPTEVIWNIWEHQTITEPLSPIIQAQFTVTFEVIPLTFTVTVLSQAAPVAP